MACCLLLAAWGLELAAWLPVAVYAAPSTDGPCPGCPGQGRSNVAYESRILSINFKFSSVAGTTKAASPTMWHQSRQSAVSWSSRGFMCQ